jgi:hypothetical protein
MLAEFEAFYRFPMEAEPVSERRTALIAELEKKGHASLIAKYKQFSLDGAHLDRIYKEGTEKRWPMPDVADPYKR